MSKGWIKLHRGLLDWEWYDDNNTKILFLHLLLKANHKEKKYKGTTIKVGQIMTGFSLLSKETGLSLQNIRTSIKRLKSTNEITIKSTSQGSIIQIVKYKNYQQVTNEVTNNQHTSNKQVTTNNNDNKEKNEKNIHKYETEEYKKELLEYFKKKTDDLTLDAKKVKIQLQAAYEYYKDLDWINSKGKDVGNLKSTIWNNWFKNDLDTFAKVKERKNYDWV